MRTNIVLDDDLMREAMALSSSTTKKDVIHEALSLYVRFKRRKDLLELSGQVKLHPDYDHKALREIGQ
ncbi:MAG: type II toxin-antitoxin system VapB family antitoxin [Acidobacteriota bacterium]|nr:MAG: type II toxin-antitoxin system VapB family antitoxin [Acidobacteriota bacterium]